MTMETLISIDERKALLWLRRNQPSTWNASDAPPARMRLKLIHQGLVSFWPGRQRFDPISYSLTDRGEKVLSP